MKPKLICLFGRKQVGKDTAAKLINELLDSVHVDAVTCSQERAYAKRWLEVGGFPSYPERFKIKHFAKPLKQILSILTGIPVASLNQEAVKNQELGEEWRVWEVYASNGHDSRVVLFADEESALQHETAQRNNGNYYVKITSKLLTVREALELIGTDLFRNKFHPNTSVNAAFARYRDENWIMADGRFQNEAAKIKSLGGITIKLERDTGCEISIAEEELASIKCDYAITNNSSLEGLKMVLTGILKKEGLL